MKTKQIKRVAAAAATGKNSHAGKSVLNINRIMVPVDFSESSQKALQYAVSLAQDYGASVVLIHVVEDRLADRRLLSRAGRDLETLAEQAGRSGVRVSTLLKVGEFIDEIASQASAARTDLLLISTHSRADIPASGLGSAAEQVVRKAPCPVLVVREIEHDFLTGPKLSPAVNKKRTKKRGATLK